ncbi:MAG: tRNA pseudouridine(38-40) synthase TruA [Brevinema sp.]
MKKTYSLELSYEGSAFKGWHLQKDFPSVQTTMVETLTKLYNEKIFVWGAGRTDSGAHALRYTAHFRTRTNAIPFDKIKDVLNGMLPPTIRVLGVREESEKFHATFTCTARTYMYLIYCKEVLPPRYYTKMFHDFQDFDYEVLKKTLKLFVGEHDFKNFCTGYTPQERLKKTTIRRLDYFQVKKYGDVLVFFIKGEGFLRGMIRMLLGVSLSVARGKISEAEIKAAFEGTPLDATQWKPVGAEGLYFKRAHYDRILHAAAVRQAEKPEE